jgi:putative membrane protein
MGGGMFEPTSAPASTTGDRGFWAFNAAASAGALAFLAYILLIREPGASGVDLRFLPAVNAGLNAIAASLLVAGYVAIRRGAQRVHKFCMVAALVASALFLACYVTYHYVHGDTKYLGTGALRTVYFAVLITHVLLSIAIAPLVPATVYLAVTRRLQKHRKLARVTLPLWLYVSVTGVLIFFLLRGPGAG